MCGNSDLVEPACRGQACGTGCTARTSGHGGRDAPWPVTGRGTLLAPGKTGWETSGGQTDPVWSSGFPTWVCVCGGGRLGRGRKPAPRADLISRDRAIDSALESMGGLFTSRPWIQQGLRICCLDYKSQLQYTSVSVALGEPAPLPAVSSSNRSSAQLGYQALRQREACLFEKRL